MTKLISGIRSAFYLSLRSWLKIKFTLSTYRSSRNDRISPVPTSAGKQIAARQETDQNEQSVVQQETGLGG